MQSSEVPRLVVSSIAWLGVSGCIVSAARVANSDNNGVNPGEQKQNRCAVALLRAHPGATISDHAVVSIRSEDNAG